MLTVSFIINLISYHLFCLNETKGGTSE